MIQRWLKSQTIKPGFREAVSPFSFTHGEGKQAGYRVELRQRVANSIRDEPKRPILKVVWNSTAFALADVVFSYERMALVSRYGDAAFRLAMDQALTRLYRSGDVAEIDHRWLGALGEPRPLLKAMFVLPSLPESGKTMGA